MQGEVVDRVHKVFFARSIADFGAKYARRGAPRYGSESARVSSVGNFAEISLVSVRDLFDVQHGIVEIAADSS